jgi:aspartate/methionine/tyrosine aminotransferase
MNKRKLNKTINNSQGNIASPEPSYPTTANLEYLNTAEAQKNYLKTNLMKTIEVFKEEINKPIKEVQENTNR